MQLLKKCHFYCLVHHYFSALSSFSKRAKGITKAIFSVCMFDQTLDSRNFNLLNKKANNFLILDLAESVICVPSEEGFCNTSAFPHFLLHPNLCYLSMLRRYSIRIHLHKSKFSLIYYSSVLCHHSMPGETQPGKFKLHLSIRKTKDIRKYLQSNSNTLIHVQ